MRVPQRSRLEGLLFIMGFFAGCGMVFVGLVLEPRSDVSLPSGAWSILSLAGFVVLAATGCWGSFLAYRQKRTRLGPEKPWD
jgi:hypothetical protein